MGKTCLTLDGHRGGDMLGTEGGLVSDSRSVLLDLSWEGVLIISLW